MKLTAAEFDKADKPIGMVKTLDRIYHVGPFAFQACYF